MVKAVTMASSKQRRKQRRGVSGQRVDALVADEPASGPDRWVSIEPREQLILVVGNHSVCRDFLRRTLDHAAGAGTLRIDGAVIGRFHYITGNDARRFDGLANVADVVVLHGADAGAVAAARRRQARSMNLLPHQMTIIANALADEDRAAALGAMRPGGYRNHVGGMADRYLDEMARMQRANIEAFGIPAPAVQVDVGALWKMGTGDRAKALRSLGEVLRPFCPAAADELATYEGGNVEPPPEQTNPFLPPWPAPTQPSGAFVFERDGGITNRRAVVGDENTDVIDALGYAMHVGGRQAGRSARLASDQAASTLAAHIDALEQRAVDVIEQQAIGSLMGIPVYADAIGGEEDEVVAVVDSPQRPD